MTSPRKFMKYTLWPVLDDETGEVDYWDVHDIDDENGNGDPVRSLFSTLDDAKEFVRERVKDDRFLASLDRAFGSGLKNLK